MVHRVFDERISYAARRRVINLAAIAKSELLSS